MMRRVIFRTEASSLIGLGHLKRCLSLARALTELGETCVFAVSKETLAISPDLQTEFRVEIFPPCYEEIAETKELASDSDIVIVDSYDLAIAWERKFKNNKLVAIDDLNRPHQVQIIVDQNFRLNYDNYYSDATALKLLGPKYALLDSSYLIERARSLPYLEREQKLLISYGGSAQKDLVVSTCLSLRKSFNPDWKSELVAGPSLAEDALIMTLKSTELNVVGQLPNLAQVLGQSQLALGAGGSMHWERSAMGVPSLVFTLAENQKQINEDLAQAGYIELLGDIKNFDFSTLPSSIASLITDQQRRVEMSKKCSELVDGSGVKRVATEILAL